jgi:hypothetical protein
MAKAPNDPQPTYMKDDSTVDISVSDLQKIFLFLDRVKLSARLSSASKKDNLVVTLPTKTVNEIKRLVDGKEDLVSPKENRETRVRTGRDHRLPRRLLRLQFRWLRPHRLDACRTSHRIPQRSCGIDRHGLPGGPRLHRGTRHAYHRSRAAETPSADPRGTGFRRRPPCPLPAVRPLGRSSDLSSPPGLFALVAFGRSPARREEAQIERFETASNVLKSRGEADLGAGARSPGSAPGSRAGRACRASGAWRCARPSASCRCAPAERRTWRLPARRVGPRDRIDSRRSAFHPA